MSSSVSILSPSGVFGDDATLDLRCLEYVSDPDENLICPICRCTFVSPVVLSDCGHCFCRECLSQSWQESGPVVYSTRECPTCRQTTALASETTAPRILTNMLDDLMTKCPEWKAGCPQTFRRSHVREHINNQCSYPWISCPFDQCGQRVRRKDATECLHYDLSCIDCRQAMMKAELETHWRQECPDREVACGLCNLQIPYRQKEVHLKEVCVANVVACPGVIVGCQYSVRKEHLGSHTEECLFATIAPSIRLQNDSLAQSEAQLRNTMRRLQVLEDGFDRLERVARRAELSMWPPDEAGIDTSSTNDAREPPRVDRADASATLSPFSNLTDPAALTPYTHLLSLHESLRSELDRVSTSLHDLGAQHSIMILNGDSRLGEEMLQLRSQVGGISRQLGWLTSTRLQGGSNVGPRAGPVLAPEAEQSIPAAVRTQTGSSGQRPSLADIMYVPSRRSSDEDRVKL